MQLATNLFLATGMVIATVLAHFVGLLVLLRLLSITGHGLRPHDSLVGKFLLLLGVVIGIVFIHSVEIWAWAALFLFVGALDRFDVALYFSTVSFSSIGYGDVILSEKWRMLGAIEGASGLILVGWSTAFLWSLMSRLRSLEHDWLERGSLQPEDTRRF